jgi:chemotaxis protein methyltransferase CheR
VSSGSIAALAELVAAETGVQLQPSQHRALVGALGRACPGVTPAAFLQLAREPLAGPQAVAALVDEITVKETSFLRDRRQLESIDWHGLERSARAAGRDTIRVWSAACATGEEPYSLALLACEAFAPAAPPVSILATDVSAAAVDAAEAGTYRERSWRPLPAALRRRYFDVSGSELRAGPQLRRLVEVRRHNLVRDPLPPLGEPAFDLVLCRNVLIYFDTPTVERLVEGLEGAVARNGRLILGAADALCSTSSRLARLATPATQERAKPARRLRRPLGRPVAEPFDHRFATALRAADEGRTEEALSLTIELLAERAHDPQLHYVRGLVELESGSPGAAVWSLRRALYLDPDFGLAAFTLGRAHESGGDAAAARRSYRQALRSLDAGDDRTVALAGQVDAGDIAAACEARLSALEGPG